MNLWWSWSREARAPLPLHRRGALAPHPPQPARAALPGRPRPHRGLRQRQRLPPPLRRRHGPAGARHDQQGHLVRPAAIPSSTAGRWRTSAPSSGSTTRCRSTPAASASSRATTARPRAISACRWWASGLFYMKGYFDQRLRLDGWQEDSDEEFDVSLTPLVPVTGAKQEPFLTTVETSGRPVHVRAWRMMVGRVPIYLLDTNLERQPPGRPRADEQALRRRAGHAAPAGVDSRRRRRARAPGHGDRPGGVARQRGPRGVHDGRAAARVRRRRAAPSTRRSTRCGRTACSPPTRRSPPGTTPSRSSSSRACAGPVWEEMGIDRDDVLPARRPSRPARTSST